MPPPPRWRQLSIFQDCSPPPQTQSNVSTLQLLLDTNIVSNTFSFSFSDFPPHMGLKCTLLTHTLGLMVNNYLFKTSFSSDDSKSFLKTSFKLIFFTSPFHINTFHYPIRSRVNIKPRTFPRSLTKYHLGTLEVKLVVNAVSC